MTSYADLYVDPQSPFIHPRRFLLEEALHKANNAVFFDSRHNWQDALGAYGASVGLLNQVMRMSLNDTDRIKLETIVSSLAQSMRLRFLSLTCDSGPRIRNAYMNFRITWHR